MSKYIINHTLPDYTTVGIMEKALLEDRDNVIVIVLDGSTNDKLQDYYERVTEILCSGNKPYIIMDAKTSNIRKAICTLCANYRDYNLYKVDSKQTITKEYVDTIIERTPTIDEVQSFIGGDISGYSDISTIIIGINQFIHMGNMDGLKEFIEQNVDSIENLTSVIDYMKKIADNTNSKELIQRIDELKVKLRDLDRKMTEAEDENKRIKDENLKLLESSDLAKSKLSRALSKANELEQQLSSNAPVMQTYSEIITSIIKCKTQSVIYFKEISYVPYVNSLIVMLMKIIALMNHRAKLIVYDSKGGLSTVYKPMSVISGEEFVANKQNFVGNVESFAVIEPNPIILTSVLESTSPVNDVVIVYDRMKQVTNLVEGNNVTKFYVVNSSKDFKEVSGLLKITDKSSIITRVDSSLGPETLNIPLIPDYSGAGVTDSAKINKYKKLVTSGMNKPLINTILSKARITASR